MKQRTEEWYSIRLGKVTGSRIADVMASLKTKPGSEAITRSNYRAEKILERYTGQCQESNYTNGAMQFGVEHEADARAAYACDRNVDVAEIGFIEHPSIAMAGCSPDGLIGEDGLLEIKCPAAGGYRDAALNIGPIEDKYIKQMLFGLACSGRKWCDYVVYRPGCPLLVRRILRDEKRIWEIEVAVEAFLEEADAEYALFCKIFPKG